MRAQWHVPVLMAMLITSAWRDLVDLPLASMCSILPDIHIQIDAIDKAIARPPL